MTKHCKNNMQIRRNRAPREMPPIQRKEAATIMYISDGTGRDSYVKSCSGGLINDYKGTSAMNQFSGGLRAHPKLPAPRKTSITKQNSVTAEDF